MKYIAFITSLLILQFCQQLHSYSTYVGERLTVDQEEYLHIFTRRIEFTAIAVGLISMCLIAIAIHTSIQVWVANKNTPVFKPVL